MLRGYAFRDDYDDDIEEDIEDDFDDDEDDFDDEDFDDDDDDDIEIYCMRCRRITDPDKEEAEMLGWQLGDHGWLCPVCAAIAPFTPGGV